MFSSFSSMDFVRRSSISSARSSVSSKSNKSERGKKKKSNKPKMVIVDPETGATFEPPKSLVPKKKQVNSSTQQNSASGSIPPLSSRGSFYGEVSVSDFDDATSSYYNSIPTSASRDESVSSSESSIESRKASFSRMPKDADRRSSTMLDSINSDSENEGVVIQTDFLKDRHDKPEKPKQKDMDQEAEKLRAAMEEERKRQKREEKERKKREEEYKTWLEGDFTITLKETPTMWFIDMFAYAVSAEDPEFEATKQENTRFVQQQKDKIEKSDNFFEVGVQTLQQFQQNQFSQTDETKIKEIKNKSLVESRSKKVSVSVWEIFDEKRKQEEEEEKEREEAENVPTLQENKDGEDGEENEEGEEENEENEEAEEKDDEDKGTGNETSSSDQTKNDISFLSSDAFRDALRRVERMVVQNQFLEKQIKYKNVGQYMMKELDNNNNGNHNEVKLSEEDASPTSPSEIVDKDKNEKRANLEDTDIESGMETTDNEEKEPVKRKEKDQQKTVSSPSDNEENEDKNRENSSETEKKESEKDSQNNEEEQESTKIEMLWEFKCSLTQNYSVQNFSFNTSNYDILAVGYSELKNKNVDENRSLVCCWTVKNPIYPERIFAIDSNSVGPDSKPIGNASIYSMCFSDKNPSLLGVGLSNGKILIYDVRQQGQIPVLATQKDHSGVWGMQFIDRGSDLGELLHYGLSSGSVYSLDVRKQRHDLLLSTQKDSQALTGTAASSAAQAAASGQHQNNAGQFFSNLMIASQAPGILCLDFDKSDPNMYLIGTEDGFIHKCSCSYGEHYLESYQGHTGPVYAVKWNNLDNDIFLSCSADWTVKIWDKNQKTPIHSIESFSSSNMMTSEKVQELQQKSNAKNLQSSIIQDVDWVPNSKTVFGSVGVSGSLEIWDLGFSTLKPRAKRSGFGCSLNKIVFPDPKTTGNGKMQSALVGTSKGSVQLFGFEL